MEVWITHVAEVWGACKALCRLCTWEPWPACGLSAAPDLGTNLPNCPSCPPLRWNCPGPLLPSLWFSLKYLLHLQVFFLTLISLTPGGTWKPGIYLTVMSVLLAAVSAGQGAVRKSQKEGDICSNTDLFSVSCQSLSLHKESLPFADTGTCQDLELGGVCHQHYLPGDPFLSLIWDDISGSPCWLHVS